MNKVENGFYGTDFNLLGEYTGAYKYQLPSPAPYAEGLLT